jgi:hypothetical protein
MPAPGIVLNVSSVGSDPLVPQTVKAGHSPIPSLATSSLSQEGENIPVLGILYHRAMQHDEELPAPLWCSPFLVQEEIQFHCLSSGATHHHAVIFIHQNLYRREFFTEQIGKLVSNPAVTVKLHQPG